jgi:DNA-binding NarL/FixJ family response regulator
MVKISANIKIMVVDDHPVIRHGIEQIIKKDRDMKVYAGASSADEAIRQINTMTPDIALIDISLKGAANGFDLVRSIKNRFPHIRTIILSMHDETRYVEQALKAGAMGYVMKNADASVIIDAIRKVHAGKIFLSDDASEFLISRITCAKQGDNGNGHAILTAREREVLDLISDGFSNTEISRRLGINIHTVSSHKRKIMDKLNIMKTTELLQYALRNKSTYTM